MKHTPHETSALIAGIAAFVTWGLVPVYWKLLRFVPATEILAHRFVWTCLFMILLLSWQRRWPEVLANLRSRRTALFCAGSGVAIAINWFVFIWAVNAGHVLETSLGYFMSPLVNVLLGAIFLRERLTRAAARVGAARERRSRLSDLRFRTAALGGSHALLFFWGLRTAAQSLGRGVDSGSFPRDDAYRAVRARLFALSREDRPAALCSRLARVWTCSWSAPGL